MSDPLLLSRIQFAVNISFHILFPMVTIALGWILVFFKWRYHRTGEDHWMESYFFYTKIFALSFALGVVSGIVMSFQFGTNWPGYMETVGNIAGPLLAYEVLTAFFLEATFLGVMLFGFRRVSPWIHNLATVLVAIGTTSSAFWILVLNSWMQTPAGYEIREGIVHATNWIEILFNPSMPYRFSHTVLASALTAGFLIAGVSAYRWLLNDKRSSVVSTIKTSILFLSVLVPLQIFVGDRHGLNTLEHQPQKLAAMEALWQTTSGAPLVLFAIPDQDLRENFFTIEIPKLGSLIATHDLDGTIRGLNEFEGLHPPVAPVFWSFRIMVGMGLTMLAIAWWGALLIYRKGEINRWYARALLVMTFSGWIATLAGWYVTEIGRQPWLVQGILRTKDAVADVPTPFVMISLTGYLLTYAFLILAYVSTIFFLAKKESQSPPLDLSAPKPIGVERQAALAKIGSTTEESSK